jgi:hypothetical protein
MNSREQFEVWAKSNNLAFTMSEGTLDDLKVTSVAFSAWQAGRASMRDEAANEADCGIWFDKNGSEVAESIASAIKEIEP